jgi:ATP-dependent RNA helicase RhlE
MTGGFDPLQRSCNRMPQSFADLGVSNGVIRALAARGAELPFPIQAMVVPDAMAGHDVLAKSRTGSGKTLAFAIPIVERLDPASKQPSALVLVPTRELATQVAEEFEPLARVRNLKVATVYGGVGLREQANRAARAHVIVATPGRLEDLVERRMLKIDGVTTLVLDEADRLLDMGFLPQVDRIVRRIPKERQTLFFSATLDGAVGHLARAYTLNAKWHEVVSEMQTVDEVDHKFIPVRQEDKVEALVDMLREAEGPALVFVRTKRGAQRLADRLDRRGVDAACLNGDMPQNARERALKRFESGKVRVMVATDVAARGLDLERIGHVVNFDLPEDDKAYVHRVGRTARAGRSGTAVTFVLPDQEGDAGRMASRLKLEDEFRAEGMVVAPPRLVFSSGGRRRRVAPRGRRTA